MADETAMPNNDVEQVRNRTIQSRKFEANSAIERRKYWHQNNPVTTSFFNGLSFIFPDVELLFINVARKYREQIKDKKLLEQIKGFIAQEAHHLKQHNSYNDETIAQGYNLKAYVAFADWNLESVRKRSVRNQLAHTLAAEHITAMFAHAILTTPELAEDTDPELMKMWYWHAIEEIDHKGVAFDIYNEVGGEYWRRIIPMVVTSIFLPITLFMGQFMMLWQDRQLFNWSAWRKAHRLFWGEPGFIKKLGPMYRAYYRRDFHPWQHNDAHLIEKYNKDFEYDTAREAANTVG